MSHNKNWEPWAQLKLFRRVQREYSLWGRARKRQRELRRLKEFRRVESGYSIWARARKLQRELRRRYNEKVGGAVYVTMGERAS